ncbi:MAG: flavodoxin domain-containing protein [Actinomycetota bacterium]
MNTAAPTVLLVVASRHGATSGIGLAIADRLSERGLRTITVTPDDVIDALDADADADADADVVDAVIVGSAVYLGHWLKPAVQFLEQHAGALHRRPVWLFSSGPLNDHPQALEGLDAPYVQHLLDMSGAREHRGFPGCLDWRSLGPVEAFVAHAVHAPGGDHRDWSEIRGWADRIAADLSGGSGGSGDTATAA